MHFLGQSSASCSAGSRLHPAGIVKIIDVGTEYGVGAWSRSESAHRGLLEVVLLASEPVLGAPAAGQDPRQECSKQHNPDSHRLQANDIINDQQPCCHLNEACVKLVV